MGKILIIILLALAVGFAAGAMYYSKWGSKEITMEVRGVFYKPTVKLKKNDHITFKNNGSPQGVHFLGHSPCTNPPDPSTGYQSDCTIKKGLVGVGDFYYNCNIKDGGCADPEIAIEPDGGGGVEPAIRSVRLPPSDQTVAISCSAGSPSVATADPALTDIVVGYKVYFAPDGDTSKPHYAVTIPDIHYPTPASPAIPVCTNSTINQDQPFCQLSPAFAGLSVSQNAPGTATNSVCGGTATFTLRIDPVPATR